MTDTLVAELGAALSPDRVRVGETELALYKRDASNIEGHAGVVCFPTSDRRGAGLRSHRSSPRPAVRRSRRRHRVWRAGRRRSTTRS